MNQDFGIDYSQLPERQAFRRELVLQRLAAGHTLALAIEQAENADRRIHGEQSVTSMEETQMDQESIQGEIAADRWAMSSIRKGSQSEARHQG